MARGWESKAVESQMEDRARPGGGRGPMSDGERARAERRAVCELSRARVVDELALCGPNARRVALQSALAALDEELDTLLRAPRDPGP